MPNNRNRQVVLASRPTGIPQAEHFNVVESPVPEPGPGEFLLRNKFLSVDPAMRGWVNAAQNYSEPVAIGAVMRAIALGEVVASNHPDYAVGDHLVGFFGWQDYAVGDGTGVWFKVAPDGAPLSASLGVLGINGITAYFGLLEVGRPQAGETVVVSTAAGAVGSAVGQIAKIKGCRTVGVAGGPDKVQACLEDFGFDAAIDYKAGDLDAALSAACPDGVDVYFDNTAGPISDAVYARLRSGARCVVCGTASVADWDPPPQGPRVERHLLVNRARIEGFLVLDYLGRAAEAGDQLAQWLAAGKLRYREDILDGLEQAPGAIAKLYAGANRGKLLIRV
jgi:hypothetical protein